LATLLGLILAPGMAWANAGVPMIVITFPLMAVALVPIVLIEAAVISARLGRPLGSCLKSVGIANALSTLVGLPLTWLGLVAAQVLTGGSGAYGIESIQSRLLAVTWQAPWLIPYEAHLYWMVPAACLTLLVPFFYVSYHIEYRAVARFVRTSARDAIARAMLRANLVSYAGLLLANGAWLAYALLAAG
jgi:hypothetical protein